MVRGRRKCNGGCKRINSMQKEWYLDFECSTHMTRRKDWFIKTILAMNNKVKSLDETNLVVKRITNVSIERMNGSFFIKDVLYIHGIKFNLLHKCQLLDKGYKIFMENNVLCIIDANWV